MCQLISLSVIIRGTVQGVGFRPFIFRLAKKFSINGYVENTNEYVFVRAEGEKQNIENFLLNIRREAPKASYVESIETKVLPKEHFSDFSIRNSRNISLHITRISPDIALCDECLTDMKRQSHRIQYPLINCTNCGPRFSIIEDLPYDRPLTTMKHFTMCDMCKREYHTVEDRRFHAQPIACNNCGPAYFFSRKGEVLTGIDNILVHTAAAIDGGKVVAIKGIGGFHLMCDALNDRAVSLLRSRKIRDNKPFAVMCKSIEVAHDYAFVSAEEEIMLTSWQAPIVLLKQRKSLAPSVNDGFSSIGMMLPYMPFHYLLFEKLHTPIIVLTSGNLSDEPIVIDEETAKKSLSVITDTFVWHNRPIHNRVDDSVTIMVNGQQRIIRRSRGFVPVPLTLPYACDAILATGAELSNCFCLGKDHEAILSQHIGDLKNAETYDFYVETIEKYQKLFRITPNLIACDLHPDYLSTRYAEETGITTIFVQHHHAHMAACMAENGIDEKITGVILDGTGLGSDGSIWGAELMIGDLLSFERLCHFEYMPLPGGDASVKEPWRTAVAYMYKSLGEDFRACEIPIMKNFPEEKISALIAMVEKNINCPQTSSAGRLFDAVAAITGLCVQAAFHAEAPMKLEALIDPFEKNEYPFTVTNVVEIKHIIRAVVEDTINKKPLPSIATKFHNTIISIIFVMCDKARKEAGLHKIVLSGGVFQNRYLLEKTEQRLKENKFEVYSHYTVPANDGGLALGQLAVAAKRRITACV